MTRLLIGIAALLLLTGCGSARRGLPLSEPVALDAEAERGQQVYMRWCQQCHPFGAGGVGPELNDKPLPRFGIALQVRQGYGAMPSFPEELVSDDELDALVEYLVTLRKAD